MAKIRVYELARDLNMTNKVLLDKIKELNLEVKSHMSSLEDDTVKKIKDGLLGKKKAKKVEEKRVKPTVIRRRKKVEKETPAEKVVEEPEVSSKTDEDVKTAPSEEQPPDIKKSKDSVTVAEVKKPKKKAAKKKKAEPSEEKVEEKKPPEEPKVVPLKAKKKEPAKAKKPVVSKKKKKSTAAKIISLPDPVPEPVPDDVPDIAEEALVQETISKDAAPDKKPAEKEKTLSKKELKKQKKKKKKPETETEEAGKDKKFLKKKISFRKKAVVEGKALYDSVKTRGRKGRKSNRSKMVVGEKTQITTPKAIKRRVKIDDTIVLSELAKRMGIKAGEMIQKLMGLGVMATVNQTIDFETAVLVASEFEYELEKASFVEETIIGKKDIENSGKLRDRAAVVTIMGHVDHGKTSLLDVIRKTSVTDTEAGGITQHIGAYNVKTDKGRITFLDTPGHEAFTSMRSRGAKVTDIVVLVVAADDGVMPQTIEAINHSKAAEVPVIVAVNKIDKPEADPERVMRELSEHNLVSEDWGGDTIFSSVSAKQKTGINNLLDMILLQAEIMELKADPDKQAKGHVVEARLDAGRGSVATVLVQEGTLKTGDPVVCGIHYGKIRAMMNDNRQIITEAGPSVPVEVVGLTGVPSAGDELIALDDEKNAKQVSLHRSQKQRSKELAQSSKVTLEGLFDKLKEGEIKDLNLIIKADVHGSIEALKDSIVKLSGDEVKINIIHSATGAISESDVSLASVSNAIIIGFNVRPSSKVTEFANEEVVDIRYYDIIYNAIKDIKDSIVGLMESTFEEDVLGRADVREVFVIPKKGTISGSYITDGKFERGQRVRLIREGIVIYDGAIKSLRRFKDDVKDVGAGFECGIGIENYNDIKVGDNLECYFLREIKPTLE